MGSFTYRRSIACRSWVRTQDHTSIHILQRSYYTDRWHKRPGTDIRQYLENKQKNVTNKGNAVQGQCTASWLSGVFCKIFRISLQNNIKYTKKVGKRFYRAKGITKMEVDYSLNQIWLWTGFYEIKTVILLKFKVKSLSYWFCFLVDKPIASITFWFFYLIKNLKQKKVYNNLSSIRPGHYPFKSQWLTYNAFAGEVNAITISHDVQSTYLYRFSYQMWVCIHAGTDT